MMSDVMELGRLEEALGPNTTVLDFWGPDCAPCRVMAPTLEALAEEYRDRVAFYRINVDERPEVAVRFGVMAVPTLVFLRRGQEVRRIVGAAARARLVDALGQALGNA